MPVCERPERLGVVGPVGTSLVGVHTGFVGACGGSALFLWGMGGRESLMIPGQDITRGAAVKGYLSLVIFEDDIGVFREGGEGERGIIIVRDVFHRGYGVRAMFVWGDEDLDGGLLDLDRSHGG